MHRGQYKRIGETRAHTKKWSKQIGRRYSGSPDCSKSENTHPTGRTELTHQGLQTRIQGQHPEAGDEYKFVYGGNSEPIRSTDFEIVG